VLDGLPVYFDTTTHNQDPYIWNDRFLHTYCHIIQMSPHEGDTILWVSGDAFPNFSELRCDLVFHLDKKIYWRDANAIAPNDPLVDSPEAYNDHYRWHTDHPFRPGHRRFTLKADPHRSFQAQDERGDLIDIVPLLAQQGVGLDLLRLGMRAGFASKPLRLDASLAGGLVDALMATATSRIDGQTLRTIRASHPELASP
jgi:hypothetical protein